MFPITTAKVGLLFSERKRVPYGIQAGITRRSLRGRPLLSLQNIHLAAMYQENEQARNVSVVKHPYRHFCRRDDRTSLPNRDVDESKLWRTSLF